NGLVDRFVTSWAGPTAVVKRIRIRLGAPNYPGDTMTLTGSVSAIDDARVTVDVVGANQIGVHVSGLVEVQV
ncbi:MAG: beta-hydroxyacyl-ACP dehydratase, partial [Nocardioides sp.]